MRPSPAAMLVGLLLAVCAVVSPAAAHAAGNPLAGDRFYVDPNTAARQQADAWRSTDPADAALLDRIATRPQADWIADWSGDPRAAVAAEVRAAAQSGTVPVLVAYDIPMRDCGSYSGGGATSPAAYQAWIKAFALGIGQARAVVVLEPDALASLGCLSAADQVTRERLLGFAVGVLTAHPGATVYLDAGHSAWIDAATMAARLRQSGIGKAQGVALDVSNFRSTPELEAYGDDLSARLGGKHFVLDTSRNGLGPDPSGQWCNPPGRALGAVPTTVTDDPLADAYLWIKHPGESDGTCNGGPPAGTFWPAYALGLAARAPG